MEFKLPARWTPLRHHEVQSKLWRDDGVRFKVVPAGRRSGKTELAKRKVIEKAIEHVEFPNARFVCAAPTRDQAKKIYWDDLKALSPKELIDGRPSESDLSIHFYNGASVNVTGMDVPERIEGPPLDGIVLDEYGNMKEGVWGKHVRPALSTVNRPGWAWMIGVPEGRNHYYDMYAAALADTTGNWAAYTWLSSDILSPDEIAAAKADLDLLTYQQEYEAQFVTFAGSIYYCFNRDVHTTKSPLPYNPHGDLIFCFDFNVAPGVAVVVQELLVSEKPGSTILKQKTCVIGEVYIPQNSNTPVVCRKLIAGWGQHKGRVLLYGDATGGNEGTAKIMGNDWDLIQAELKPVFGDRLRMRVPPSNGAERVRVNSVNTRLKTASGAYGILIDVTKAPMVVKDLEGVRVLEGSDGEIDKKTDSKLTHPSDALGYYIVAEFPIKRHAVSSGSV